MSHNQPPNHQSTANGLFEFEDEWSFNLDQSHISSEVDHNDTLESKETTIVVDKNVYEDLVTTCNTMKVQLKTVMEKIEKKKEADDKKNVEIGKLKSECDELKKNNKELLKKLEQEEKKKEELFGENQKEKEKNEVNTANLNSEMDALAEVIEDLKKKLGQEAKEKEEWKNKMEEQENILNNLSCSYSTLELEIHEWRDKLQDVNNKNDELAAKLAKEIKEKERKSSDQIVLQNMVDELMIKVELEDEHRKELDEKEEEKNVRTAELKTERDALKGNIQELTEKLKLLDELNSTFTVKFNAIEQSSKLKDDEMKTLQRKYSNMKKRGIQMLAEKSEENQKLQQEISEQQKKFDEQKGQLEELKNSVNLEKEKRKKYENEVKAAERIVKDALREEKISRKMTEKKYLVEKTEKLALQDKVKEMTTRGVVVHKSCPNTEHSLLVQRIDVLQRQRDIMAESINNREPPI